MSSNPPSRLRCAAPSTRPGGRVGSVPLRILVPRLALLLLLAALGSLGCRSAEAAARWDWPLPPPHPVTRLFAVGPQPWSPGHRGVDLAGPPGSPVHAAGAGRVTFAGALAGRSVVVVDHGELRTTYEPVTASVPVGVAVRTGDVLGRLNPGHTGCPAAACLHWGLLRGGTYLDPLRLVVTGPVRLLPRVDLAVPAGGRVGADAQASPTSTRPPATAEPAGGGRAGSRPSAPGGPAAVVTAAAAGLLATTRLMRRQDRRGRPRVPT